MIAEVVYVPGAVKTLIIVVIFFVETQNQIDVEFFDVMSKMVLKSLKQFRIKLSKERPGKRKPRLKV